MLRSKMVPVKRALLSFACVIFASCENPGAADRPVTTGLWGGVGIRLEVMSQGATIEYDCAHGTIDQPLVADRNGRFSLTGTHVREHGGPIRIDEPVDRHPARYDGKVRGTSMQISVTLLDSNQAVGTFAATLNGSARIVKCL